MYSVHTIILKTSDGSYVADYWQAANKARTTHRRLVREIADLWPELWGGRKPTEEQREWRRWVKSLEKLCLGVILTQK